MEPDEGKQSQNPEEPPTNVVEDPTPPTPETQEPSEAPPEEPKVAEAALEQPALATTSSVKKHSKRKLILIIVLALLLTGGGVAAGLYFKNDSSKTPTTNTDKKQSVDMSYTDADTKKFITPTTGEKWYATPKTISPQGYMKAEYASNYDVINGPVADQMEANKPEYWEVGTRADKTIVLVSATGEGLGSPTLYLFEKDASGNVVALLKPQARAEGEFAQKEALKGVVSDKVKSIDETIHYDSLNIPAKLSVGNGEYATRAAESLYLGNFETGAPTSAKYIEIGKYGESRLERIETKFTDTKLTNIGYQIKLPIGTVLALYYEPNGATLEGYTFTNGASTQVKDYNGQTIYDPIGPIARGCSFGTVQVTRTDELKVSDLTAIGKTASGRTVYEPTNINGTLYKKAYDEYKQLNPDGAKSLETYRKDHGLIVIENAKKELLIYTRETYSAVGGCAKPVVYLYPTVARSVSVQVGANVTVSDPTYPVGGWQGVWAEPSGKLTYKGSTYDSLFWEGQGYGRYPGITSGAVVKRTDAAKTIRQQLAAQGLNAKEIADFMDFWTDKIPAKPYIRLTWFNTSQMDTLAPLKVTPAPQTIIRVFLDMDGFDTPLKLEPQKLVKTERRGFTVVEWGGLTSTVRH